MVGRGTPEPKRLGTSCKTNNGNGGRTENPPAVGSVKRCKAKKVRKNAVHAVRGFIRDDTGQENPQMLS